MIRVHNSESYALRNPLYYDVWTCANPDGPWWQGKTVDEFLLCPLTPRENLSSKANVFEYNFDELRQPDTYESLAFGTSFSYREHTWNSVFNVQSEGDLVNIQTESGWIPSALKQYKLTKDKIKYLFPGHSFRGIKCNSSCRSGSDRIYRYHMVPYVWDPVLLGWHTYELIWYSLLDSDGYWWRSNAYGNKVSALGQNHDLRHYFYAMRWDSTQQKFLVHWDNTVYKSNGTRQGNVILINPWDNITTVYERVQELFSASAEYLITTRSNWRWWDIVRYGEGEVVSRSHRHLPDLRRPNYDAIFAEYNSLVNWHALAAEAYQNLGMADVNSVSNLKELLEMGGAVMGFIDTLKSLPSKKVKAAASAWLAVHYGFKLTILDALELRETLKKFSSRRENLTKCQASTTLTGVTQIEFDYRYQVFYDQFAKLESMLEQLLSISDAFITLENSWDMVPWSFVIDWFVQVGDWLQSLDNYANLVQKHDVICTGRSVRAVYDALPSQIGIYPDEVGEDAGMGMVTLKFYKRVYSPNLIKPSLLPSATVNLFDHMIEVAALYISIK